MTVSPPVPMAIEQFDQAGLPDTYELHGGKPVEMTLARPAHRETQWQICRVLEQLFKDASVRIEMTFQVAATNDKRSADVGVTSADRWQAALEETALTGAPEIVVEVLSPSNSVLELQAYQSLCLDFGTEVFLIVNPDARTVEVRRKGSRMAEIWGVSEEFALELWGERHVIEVRDLFAGLPEKRSS
ncbi:MAG TPA: Uma2 family endonuclease [Bryobacteraceae bacterium]|nr:Uma2 family endonuclease [Bryobacteraceae bacterium]